MSEFSVVGKRMPKSDSVQMATGETKFGTDMILPGMLHGKVLYSPYAHAKILNIDTAKAARVQGVKAVITGKDTPGIPFGITWGPPPDVRDSYVLTTDKVRYTGDAIAAVAAVDMDAAEEALDLIEIEYEELPVINNLEEALDPESIKIHDYADHNTIRTVTDGYGDVEKGFDESDYVREDTFKFPVTSYMMPEPQGCTVSYDAASDRYTFWSGATWVFMFRSSLAIMLDVPYQRIKVIPLTCGASFGGRGTWIYPAHLCAAVLSKKVAGPVKIVNSREEDFAHRCATHEAIVRVKTGVKNDGTLVSRDASIIYDVGAYSGFEASMGTTPNACWFHVPYKVDNLKATLTTVFTNKPPHGPFRSYGNMQPLAACELQMEIISKELGLDPTDVRMKSTVEPYSETGFGWEIKSCGLTTCLDEVGKSIGWDKRGEDLPPYRGKGIGSGMFNSVRGGSPDNPITATIVVNEDGSADLFAHGTESGSGQFFAMRMIIAEELGIQVENVRKPLVDTDTSLDKEGVVLVTISAMGRAPQMAAIDARRQIFDAVAEEMEANVQDLESKDGRVFVKGSPEKGMSFADAARMTIKKKGSIVGKGEYVSSAWERGPDYVWGLYKRFGVYGDAPGHGYGATGIEVEVDRETGQVRILQMAHAYDVGFALNPLLVEAQLEGGAAIAAGGMWTEELVIDKGQIVNPSYLGYGLIGAMDIPKITPIVVESGSDASEGPFGAKELGMGVITSGGPAVISAIYNATGVMLKEFPATPERILKALKAKEQGTE